MRFKKQRFVKVNRVHSVIICFFQARPIRIRKVVVLRGNAQKTQKCANCECIIFQPLDTFVKHLARGNVSIMYLFELSYTSLLFVSIDIRIFEDKKKASFRENVMQLITIFSFFFRNNFLDTES